MPRPPPGATAVPGAPRAPKSRKALGFRRGGGPGGGPPASAPTGGQPGPAALLDRIAREASRLMEAERASVFLLDRERRELWTQVALGSEPFRFDARKGIAGAAALSGETINVRDARTDPRFLRDIDEM